MKFIINREKILNNLKKVNFLFRINPIIPILNNILLKIKNGVLTIIGTDLEIEIILKIKVYEKNFKNGELTVCLKKIFNIFKCLPKNSIINLKLINNEKLKIVSNFNKYILSTLPINDFPSLKKFVHEIEFKININDFINAIKFSFISMGNNDVRYYLNGMLFKIENNNFITVSTDGHRLSFYKIYINCNCKNYTGILSRKTIIELIKILNIKEKTIKIKANSNSIRILNSNYIFTSKLIENYFPKYENIIFNKYCNVLNINRKLLKDACIRTSVLYNEKNKGLKFHLKKNKLKIYSNNLENEKSEEILNVNYNMKEIKFLLNYIYIIDVLNTLNSDYIKIYFNNINSEIKIQNINDKESFHIIMPIKI